MANAARDVYDLAFQVSPIILKGGIAATAIGGMLPIIGLVGQLGAFAQGAASSGSLNSSDFFARYLPIPGGNIINNSVGMYPFANQQVAANAVIEQPLSISMLMIAPVKDTAGYLTKLPLFTALQTSLRNHNNAGGTYIIATPAFVYTDCLMLSMTDVTGSDTKQKQVQWQMEFIKPLVSVQDGAAAYNGLISKLSGGQKVTSSAVSGPSVAVGSSAQGASSANQNVTNLIGGVNQFLASPAI